MSFIQFVDDSLSFMEIDPESFPNLRCILLFLEMVSGLKVNLGKSLLFPVGCVPNIDVLTSILGCEVDFLSSTYLGFPLERRCLQNPYGSQY